MKTLIQSSETWKIPSQINPGKSPEFLRSGQEDLWKKNQRTDSKILTSLQD